jgi:hypothetical protein
MKNYLEEWAVSVQKRPSSTLKAPVEITGVRNQHMGPRWEFATINLKIEPAEGFSVNTALLPSQAHLEENGYLNAAVMGLLDILLTAEAAPLKNINVIFLNVEEHPIDSSQMAFRQAGRDAARKLLKANKALHSNTGAKS